VAAVEVWPGGGDRRGVACGLPHHRSTERFPLRQVSGSSRCRRGEGEDTSIAAVGKDVCCMVLAAILARLVRVVLS
jgi:hypothetical protein